MMYDQHEGAKQPHKPSNSSNQGPANGAGREGTDSPSDSFRSDTVHSDSTSAESSRKTSFDEHLARRLTDVFQELRVDELFNRAVVRARNMSPLDMTIAALNGMSFHVNYGIPTPPLAAKDSRDPIVIVGVALKDIPSDALLVSRAENPTLFQHVLWCVENSPHFSPKQLEEVMKVEVLSITENAFLDYIDTLQRSSRFFRGEGRRLLDPLAELVALQAHQSLNAGKKPIAADNNAIRMIGAVDEGLVISVVGDEFVQRILPGSRVLMAGGAYNSLNDIRVMKSLPDFRFVIHDNDPFVSTVLKHVVRFQNADNIQISDHGASNLHRYAPYDAAFLSNVTSMSRPEALEFAEAAAVTLVKGSPVHICQRETPLDAFGLTPQNWKDAFRLHGFGITMLDQYMHNVSSPAIELRQDELLKMTGAEMLARARTHARPNVPQPYRFTVLRLPAEGDVLD